MVGTENDTHFPELRLEFKAIYFCDTFLYVGTHHLSSEQSHLNNLLWVLG